MKGRDKIWCTATANQATFKLKRRCTIILQL